MEERDEDLRERETYIRQLEAALQQAQIPSLNNDNEQNHDVLTTPQPSKPQGLDAMTSLSSDALALLTIPTTPVTKKTEANSMLLSPQSANRYQGSVKSICTVASRAGSIAFCRK